VSLFVCYLRRRLASGEGIVTLGFTLSRRVCVRRRISLSGEDNALYPVLSKIRTDFDEIFREVGRFWWLFGT